MKENKHLNEAQKYEIWKTNFKKEMETKLNKLFFRNSIVTPIHIRHADKWNVEFQVYGMTNYIDKLKDLVETTVPQDTLQVLNYQSSKVNNACSFLDLKLTAKEEKELEIKLAYLNMLF